MKKQRIILVLLAVLSCCLVLAGCENKRVVAELEAVKSELAKSLVAYWPANNTRDYSIYNNNVTLRGGAIYATGKYGQAFSLTRDSNPNAKSDL